MKEPLLLIITIASQLLHAVKEFPLPATVLLIVAAIIACWLISSSDDSDYLKTWLSWRGGDGVAKKSVKYYLNQLPGPQCVPLLGNSLLMATDREG